MIRKGILNEQSFSWVHSPVISPTPPSLTFRPGEALSCHVAQVRHSPVIATEPSLVISRERSESRNLFLSALCLEQITLNKPLLIIKELAIKLCEVATICP